MVWMHHHLFTHSPSEGHLCCFQVLAIMSKVADLYVDIRFRQALPMAEWVKNLPAMQETQKTRV